MSALIEYILLSPVVKLIKIRCWKKLSIFWCVNVISNGISFFIGISKLMYLSGKNALLNNVKCFSFSNEEFFSFVSKDGILGQRKCSVFLQSRNLDIGDMLIMHSDGVHDIAHKGFKPIHFESPEGIVHRVLRDFGKSTDDISCLGVKL